MTSNNNELWGDKDEHPEQYDHDKPRAYQIEDNDNLKEKDLKRTYLFGNSKVKSMDAPGMEGQGMGGAHFGQNNLTPSGNDTANPSQNAGYDSAHSRHTQPSEEHLENPITVAHGQQDKAGDFSGQPNIPGPNEVPDQQKVGEGKGEHTSNPQQSYQEGTSDNDGQKSNQSKNTTGRSGAKAEKEHIET